MGIKKNKIEQDVPKQPKTIKVSTLIIIIAWLVSVVASLYIGWSLKQNDETRVHSEAKVMLNSFIETAKSSDAELK